MAKLTPKNQQERRGSGRPSGAAPSGSRLDPGLASILGSKRGSQSPSKASNQAQAPNVAQARQRLSETASRAAAGSLDPELRRRLQTRAQQVLEPQERDAPFWAKVLSAIDVPRAAVFSGGKELSDLIGGGGEASFDDLGRQIEEHRGFGDIEALQFAEGDEWWERGLKATAALAGDVATDPLTYLTVGVGPAAVKGTSLGARLGTAARVAERGAARIGAKEAGELATKEAVDAAITQAAKRGSLGLSRAEREAADLGTLSLRLGGKAIPGTQGIAEGLSEARLALRGVLPERLASRARRLAGAPDEIPLIERAVGRGADDATRATAVKARSAMKAEKAGGRQFVDEANRGLLAAYRAVRGVKDDDIAKLVEAGDVRVKPISDWLANVRKEAVVRGADIGDLADYHPHRITPEFRAKLAESDRLKSQVTGKLDSPEAPQLMRKYTAGETFMGVVTNGTIEDLNRIARSTPGIGVDVFEKSSGKVLPAYAESLGRAVGKVRAGGRLEELGAATRIPNRPVIGTVPASRTAKALAKELAASGRISGEEADVLAAQAAETAVLPGAASVPEFDRTLNRLVLDDQKVAQVDNAVLAAERPDEAILQTQASIDDQLSRLAEDSPLRDGLVEAKRRIDIVQGWVAQNPSSTPWQRRVVAMEQQAIDLNAKSLSLKGDAEGFEQIAKALRSPMLSTRYVHQVDSGMAALSKDLQAEPWLVDAMTASTKMRDPKAWDGLLKGWDKIMNYVKSWQVATPGFVVRNTYGGMWNNYAAYNVGPVDYANFIRDHVKYRKAAKAGRDWTTEVDPQFAKALEAVSASGSGQTAGEVSFDLLDRRLNPLSTRGPATRFLRNRSEDVEIFMRGALAHKVIRQGGTVDEAIQAIERIHFNYRDISEFDRGMKRVIPYWVFTSRNLPLQLELMATHPQKFLNAVRAKESIEDDTINEGEVTPQYLDDMFGGKVGRTGAGDSIFLTPDLPFVRLGSTAQNAARGPIGVFDEALENVTPLIKAPAEVTFGRKSFTGEPFVEGKQVPLWFGERWLGPAMGLAGMANQTADGGWMIPEKTSYLLEQWIPLLGRARRQFPNEPRYQARVNTSWMSFFGVSVRTNTDNAQWGEIARQQKELDGWLKEQEDLGFLKPRRRR